MTISPPSPLEHLRLADPETFEWVVRRLNSQKNTPSQQVLTWLADETTWALTLEKGLALALADAIIELAAHAAESAIPALIEQVHEATATGATLASIVAAHTGPVLRAGPVLLSKFQTLLPVMLAKGTYTLKPPLILLSELLASSQTEAADAFIDLLITIFRQPMSYNQSLGLVYQIPQAVRHFPSERRAAQLRQFSRIVECGLNLVAPFLEGMQKGLELLPPPKLAAFLDQVLSRCRPDGAAAASCLSLQSRLGLETYAALQTAASLTHVRPSLNRYLSARLGSPLSIKSLADLNASGKDSRTWVCSDGQAIFARDEIRCHESASRNADLYLTLMRIEAGFYECRSFSFDLERAAVRYPVVRQWLQRHGAKDSQRPGGDAHLFFESFSEPRLAEDLFMIVELGRVSQCMHQRYPGMRRRTAVHLDDEIRRLIESGAWRHPLAGAYLRLVTASVHPIVSNPDDRFTAGLHQLFMDTIDAQSPVEACAPILCRTFDRIWSAIRTKFAGYADFAFPFNIRLRWDLIQAAMTTHKRQADEIHRRLSEKGLSAYQADLRYQLLKGQGRITAREMKELIADKARDDAAHADGIHLLGRSADVLIADAQIEALLNPEAAADQVAPDAKAETFFYPEWDFRLQDYLQAHTRIQEAELPGEHSESFYQQSLERYAGLVAHMRRAFERLRPEGWAMLRQWPDGDAFDYRALLDYAIDRRTGHIPSRPPVYQTLETGTRCGGSGAGRSVAFHRQPGHRTPVQRAGSDQGSTGIVL